MKRRYSAFSYKDSHFRISSPRAELIRREIIRQRTLLEQYLQRQPQFRTAMTPLGLLPDPPEIVICMHRAALLTGVGPMAAVAGTIAQLSAKAALAAGAAEAIVENGGDLYLASPDKITVALYAGSSSPIAARLAFAVPASRLPLAICSSSSRLGHSHSFGDCDLATVVAADASLADAAATLAGNLVRTVNDIDTTLERIVGIAGIQGVLLIKDNRIGLIGSLPELIRNTDGATVSRITRDPASQFKP